MRKLRLLTAILMAVFCLQFCGEFAEAAQTINGKAIGSIDDIVKEVNGGDLSLPKKGLITLRGGDKIDDVDVFTTTFGEDASASTKRLWHNSNATQRLNWTAQEPYYLRPAVSRRLYNGKRALMFHNLAPNGSLKYFFKTLSSTKDENMVGATPDNLTNTIRISDFGTYTSPAFSNAENYISEVYGTGVMSVKGYDREIFVAASGVNRYSQADQEVRLEFFALNADDNGNMTYEALTGLTRTTPFRQQPYIVSIAVGDFDGDKYNNEVALMINARQDIWIFVYRLNYSNGKLELTSLDHPRGIHAFSTNQWDNDIERQPVTDMVAGDFDGDGTDEIALLFKIPNRSNAGNIKDAKGWPDGPMVGDIHCKILKWNAGRGAYDIDETSQSYTQTDVTNGTTGIYSQATVSGVIGLRAAAADLDGDGKSEIVTLLLGYYHRKAWNSDNSFLRLAYEFRRDDFYAYPHLAVWTFNRGSIKPIHDSHVKGGGESGEYRYNWGKLYNMSDNKSKGLLMNQPHLEYRFIWDEDNESNNKKEGTNPDDIKYMYAPRMFSIAAGPFTGKIGNLRTVDDIAVAWRDRDGNDCVTIFKTKLNAGKQFDGFEDGKIALRDATGSETWRGLVAVDMAGEGVELGTPSHMRKHSNRSYVAALSAIPYHVDNVSADGTALTKNPVNFTYSEVANGGNMTVSYGRSTTDSTTNTVKQDLSQSIETMFLADPTGTNKNVQQIFGKVKGLVGFASAIGNIAHGIKVGNMTTEQKQAAVWQPPSPTAQLPKIMDFLTDKIDLIDQRTNSEASTTTIDKTITATTYDSILFTDTARHIWRYPVLTRPIPLWLAAGPRIDSNPIDKPSSVKGEKELFLTFTMSEHSALRTLDSINDDLYQPLHEEGNFFSYPSQIGDVEGYNDAGILADQNMWGFSNTLDNTGITFTKATSNMQHTEKKVTPSGFTATVSFFDRLFNGNKATGIKMPDSDNPKTFSKEYSKSERISYSLQGSSILTAMQAADHTIKMQPFVAKEGAMTLGTAVELSSTNSARLWENTSVYRKMPDPALLLPHKFVKSGSDFKANTYDKSAMKIRGIRFYMPDFSFFTDNRLVNGQNYEIRVPLYNASFVDTGNFNVRLSWTTKNSPTSAKTVIGTVSMTLGGWRNDKTNNRGTAVFNWQPNIPKGDNYYFYVEIDPENAITEVHEGRYRADNTTLNDYGGNNTGFYPFKVYNQGDTDPEGGSVLASGAGMFSAAADEVRLTPLYFTDGDNNRITDMAAYMRAHSDDSFVTITANFSYSGEEIPYALFMGSLLTQSGRQKLPGASLNTVVDLSSLAADDIEDVFMVSDIALFNGNNQVTFTVSPAELLASESEIRAAASSATFGVLLLTDEVLESFEEEFYEGEDPDFELEPISDDIVSSATGRTYTLSANENVFWIISGVKHSGTVSTSDEEDDDRNYLDITLETLKTSSEDEAAPDNYGKEAVITVSSIAGYTPKGDYEITVQKSADGDVWETAGVLKFNTDDSESSGGGVSSSSSGCNAGLSFGTLAFLLSGLMAFRRKN